MKPDFVFVGPSKSGSTWIFELLRSHPQVYVPLAKDIYFFDRYFEKGFSWYEDFFSPAKPGQVCGELSHDYLSNPEALRRLAGAYPGIKVICCLRNPYERAISSYKFIRRNGLLDTGIADAITKYPEIYEEGLYGKHLKNVFSLFDRIQVLILDFDELGRDPQAIAEKIFRFLGVDEKFQSPVIGKKINSAAHPRSKLLARLVKQSALSFRNLGFSSFVGAVKRNSVIRWLLYTDIRQSRGGEPQMVFPEVMISGYEKDLSVLSALLGRDFDAWRHVGNGKHVAES